jgi:hypothetical protein
MKPKNKNTTPDHGQALAEFDQLPDKTKRLLELKQQAEKATGEASVEIQKKIRKHSSAK